MDTNVRATPDSWFENPRRAWSLFGVAWATCAVLTVVAQLMAARNVDLGLVAFLILLVVAPIPVFASFLLVPHAISRVRALGRHEPWMVGFAVYVLAGCLFFLVQWARIGHPAGGVFLWYAWPGLALHEVGCIADLWECLRID